MLLLGVLLATLGGLATASTYRHSNTSKVWPELILITGLVLAGYWFITLIPAIPNVG
jgi:hypothetical protein